MFRRFPVFLATLALLLPIQAEAKPKKQTQLACEPIGRLLTPQAQVLCKGFTKLFKKEAKVLCFSNLEIIPFIGGKLAKDCLPLKQQKAVCQKSADAGKVCPKFRGGVAAANLRLLQPYGSLLIKPRPKISWTVIPESKTYRISLEDASKTTIWAATTQGNEIRYPTSAPPLRRGTAYRIIVQTSINDSSDIQLDDKTVVILAKTQQQKLNQAIAQIKSLNLSDDQKALDTAMVYQASSLLNQEINVLEQRIAKGTQDSRIPLRLATRYLEEGWVEPARKYVQESHRLAQLENDQEAISAAQELLETIEIISQAPPT